MLSNIFIHQSSRDIWPAALWTVGQDGFEWKFWLDWIDRYQETRECSAQDVYRYLYLDSKHRYL